MTTVRAPARSGFAHRLAAHIARRSSGHGEDPRYEAMLARAPGNRWSTCSRRPWCGWCPCRYRQRSTPPKADPANRGRIMDRGLWRLTRHPDYFGDFCVWWGLFLIACDGGRQAAAAAAAAVSVASPLVMSVLLIRGSGKRLLERHMAARPGWDAYAARTSGFFPRLPRRS